MKNGEIVKALREHAEWAQANEWETPITLSDDLAAAADLIEKLTDRCARYTEEIAVAQERQRWIPVTERLPEQGGVERLAAYEDTGREPEEITAMQRTLDEYHKVADPLLRAQADGRLVVLPCKVGDTLWVTGRDNVPQEMELEAPDIRAVCTDEDNLCMSTCNRKPDGFCAYRLRNDGADIGKIVFLTSEEAEAALEAMKDE